jgi:hypothetical protein
MSWNLFCYNKKRKSERVKRDVFVFTTIHVFYFYSTKSSIKKGSDWENPRPQRIASSTSTIDLLYRVVALTRSEIIVKGGRRKNLIQMLNKSCWKCCLLVRIIHEMIEWWWWKMCALMGVRDKRECKNHESGGIWFENETQLCFVWDLNSIIAVEFHFAQKDREQFISS